VTSTSAYVTETAWSGSNGGFSQAYTKPSFQSGIQANDQRGVPDLAANADPNTGFYICYSTLYTTTTCYIIGGIKFLFFNKAKIKTIIENKKISQRHISRQSSLCCPHGSTNANKWRVNNSKQF